MSNQKVFCYDPSDNAKELNTALVLLAEDYPLIATPTGADYQLRFVKVTGDNVCKVERSGKIWTITYTEMYGALRGVGLALGGNQVDEKMPFSSFGIMLDASRNAVMTVGHFKKWLRKLAIFGYNMAMLYTEETFRLPEQPYFGYMRGGYTLEELQEIDAYADGLGIEMIACCQCLGHLEQYIRWNCNPAEIDTARVLLVDSEPTYTLIDNILKFWQKAFKSRRIHLGMDETHDLGRGRFMDWYGYQRNFDLFNRHLTRVTEMCHKYDFDPMIWSDMYFRMANKELDYYDLSQPIPADVIAQIPENFRLVYWDYYHKQPEFYAEHLRAHQALNRPVSLGSGVWTWSLFFQGPTITRPNVRPAVMGARETGIDEVFFTMWGDDGAYCDFDSAFSGLLWSADLAWAGEVDDAIFDKRFKVLCDSTMVAQTAAGKLDIGIWDAEIDDFRFIRFGHLLWDDPVFGIAWNYYKLYYPQDFPANAIAEMANIVKTLKPYRHETAAGNIGHAYLLAQTAGKFLELRQEVLAAYDAKDIKKLKHIRRHLLLKCIDLMEEVEVSAREVWLTAMKPFGLEQVQSRNATKVMRLKELDRILDDFCSGRRDRLEELEERLPEGTPAHLGWGVNAVNRTSC